LIFSNIFPVNIKYGLVFELSSHSKGLKKICKQEINLFNHKKELP